MFDVGGITAGNTGSNYSPLGSGEDASILDRDDFLMLLIAELQHQDPMNPIDNQDYVSQLTQFSSLDELRGIREVLDGQDANAASNLNAQSIGMIGRDVTVVDSVIEHRAGQEVELAFQLPSDSRATITVYNSRGQAVRTDTIQSGHLAGWDKYVFDGRSDQGYTLPDGVYAVQVTSGGNGAGAIAEHPVYQVGRVVGVDFTTETTMLQLDSGQSVALANVVGVREASE